MGTFLKDLFGYIFQRVLLLLISSYTFIVGSIYNLKGYLVQNLFWGRNNLYRNVFQVSIVGLTLILGFSGVTNTFALGSQNRDNSTYLSRDAGLIDSSLSPDIEGRTDQFRADPRGDKYIVQSGDTLEVIARKIIQVEKGYPYFDETEVTNERVQRKIQVIRFINNLFAENPKLRAGQELTVYIGIDGTIHKVIKGDTVASLSRKYKVDEQTIVEANRDNIDADFIDGDTSKISLEEGSSIVIPNIDLSETLSQEKSKLAKVSQQQTVSKRVNVAPKTIAGGDFGFPLGGDCGGWNRSRGFTSYHKGIDIARGGGCTIVSADSGTVVQAGWTNGGGGYQVEINHGNGFLTRYSHMSSGSISVSPGMVVGKGVRLGYMGCTGRCTGTHLHFMMEYNGVVINPAPKIGL